LVRLTGALLRDPNVDCILTYTGRFANEIQASFGKGVELPIRSLYPIVDLARFHPLDKEGRTRARAELGISDETFVITSHSNMRPVKAPEDVLNIAHAVSEAVAREVLLLLIGPSLAMEALPPSSKLRIRQMGVLDRVEGILQISDLELNCSYHDSFNLSLGEAMACGVPCATTDVVGIADELRGSGGGVLFALEPPEEVPRGRRYEAVVSDIAYLANNEPLRRKLATAAHERASATFSRRRVLPALAALMTDTFRNSESAQGGEGDQSSLPATGGS
jgi:glycosyltransferase involved in cell wall biosynthesis